MEAAKLGFTQVLQTVNPVDHISNPDTHNSNPNDQCLIIDINYQCQGFYR